MKTALGLVAQGLLLAALAPAVSLADDDLDVTMEVIDDPRQLDEDMVEMRGPGDAAGAAEDGDTEDEAAEIARARDEFEYDDVDDTDDDVLNDEGDFEPGEQVDDDEYDDAQHLPL